MNTKTSIRRYITIYLGAFTLIIVLVYSVLLHFFLIAGMDKAATKELRLVASEFEDKYKLKPDSPLPSGPRLHSYLNAADLPWWVKDEVDIDDLRYEKINFGKTPFYENESSRSRGSGHHMRKRGKWRKGFHRFNDRHGIFLLYPHRLPDGKTLYLLNEFTRHEMETGGIVESAQLEAMTWILGIGVILLFILAVRFVINRLSLSVESLSDWAGDINRDNLGQEHPNFDFKELNRLADILHGSMNDLNEALVREQNFLRNASHELRTPIAVIQSNMDLLDRLRKDSGEAEKKPYERIRRAVNNMQSLTETLLWLSRKEHEAPVPEKVSLKTLIQETVEDNRYLLTGKDVELTLEMDDEEVVIPLGAGKIAISNLIRNAFQYTGTGEVKISSRSGQIVISNSISLDGDDNGTESDNDYGFGLGLALVEEIAGKMNWKYASKKVPGGHQAILSF